MATRHDKETRFRIRGNPELASKFLGEAQKYLGQLLNDMGLGGNATGHRVLQNPQGVKFAVSKMMEDAPIIDIDVSAAKVEGQKEEDVVIIAVAHVGGGEDGWITFHDANDGSELFHLELFSVIDSIVGAPNAPHVYVIDHIGSTGRAIRVNYDLLSKGPPFDDLNPPVVGSNSPGFTYSSIAVSPDGSRTYAFVNPVVYGEDISSPGGYATYTMASEFEFLVFAPDAIPGMYSVTAANLECTRLYNIWQYDDGNPLTDSEDPGEDNPDYAANSVHVQYATEPGADLFAFPLHNFLHDNAFPYPGIVVNRAGTRLYVAGKQSDELLEDLSTGVVPTFYCINIEDDANAVIHARTKEDNPLFADFTGGLAVSHDGRFAYTMGRQDDLVRMIDLEDDACEIVETFPFREAGDFFDEVPDGRPILTGDVHKQGYRIVMGPHGGLAPDNRVYFMSWVQSTIWSFDVGSTAPYRKLTIPYWGSCFALFKYGTRQVPT